MKLEEPCRIRPDGPCLARWCDPGAPVKPHSMVVKAAAFLHSGPQDLVICGLVPLGI